MCVGGDATGRCAMIQKWNQGSGIWCWIAFGSLAYALLSMRSNHCYASQLLHFRLSKKKPATLPTESMPSTSSLLAPLFTSCKPASRCFVPVVFEARTS